MAWIIQTEKKFLGKETTKRQAKNKAQKYMEKHTPEGEDRKTEWVPTTNRKDFAKWKPRTQETPRYVQIRKQKKNKREQSKGNKIEENIGIR